MFEIVSFWLNQLLGNRIYFRSICKLSNTDLFLQSNSLCGPVPDYDEHIELLPAAGPTGLQFAYFWIVDYKMQSEHPQTLTVSNKAQSQIKLKASFKNCFLLLPPQP